MIVQSVWGEKGGSCSKVLGQRTILGLFLYCYLPFLFICMIYHIKQKDIITSFRQESSGMIFKEGREKEDNYNWKRDT